LLQSYLSPFPEFPFLAYDINVSFFLYLRLFQIFFCYIYGIMHHFSHFYIFIFYFILLWLNFSRIFPFFACFYFNYFHVWRFKFNFIIVHYYFHRLVNFSCFHFLSVDKSYSVPSFKSSAHISLDYTFCEIFVKDIIALSIFFIPMLISSSSIWMRDNAFTYLFIPFFLR